MSQDPPSPEPIDISHLTGKSVPSNSQPVSTGSIYFLKKDELDKHTELGENGIVESAVKVLNYYSFSGHDEDKEMYWLEKCSALGHAVSQYNFATSLFEKGQYKESLGWAKRALENGSKGAASLIERIENR